MASYQFLVTIELRRESGKFAGREEIVQQISERLQETASEEVEGVGADGESVYVVDDCDVEEYFPPKMPKKGKT